MTPQVPEYLVTFEAGIRPLVTAIALRLIWMGAPRMEGPAQSRYATAGALSVVLIAWLAVAQYLGSANAYFATRENAVLFFFSSRRRHTRYWRDWSSDVCSSD